MSNQDERSSPAPFGLGAVSRRQVLQGMAGDGKKPAKAHPLTLLRKAYGI